MHPTGDARDSGAIPPICSPASSLRHPARLQAPRCAPAWRPGAR
ncbi:MAG: hypothetical protein FJY26_09375 [Betaproteobacteria bacterium]|nr:hypothetical protein [Betaproteobacteria bacterium]